MQIRICPLSRACYITCNEIQSSPIMPRERLQESELFRFINNETPSARNWLLNYLNKKGLPVTVEFPDDLPVVFFLENHLKRHGFNYDSKKALARDMANAWRGFQRRKNKNVVSLTVGLDKSVFTKLSEMSKGLTQAKIITQLIEGNYPIFLAHKREQERIKADEKASAVRLKNTNLIMKMMGQTHSESSLVAKQINAAKDLKDVILMIEDIARVLTRDNNNQAKP